MLKVPNKVNRRKSNRIDSTIMEAQRVAEEERKREEQMRILEEKRKYEIIKLESGLELIMTEWSIGEAWKSTRPKQVFLEILNRYLKKKHLNENFESIEINILSEFISNAMIFAKEEMLLDNFRASVFVNLIFYLLQNDNLNYSSKTKVVNPLRDKSWERDYDELTKILKFHSTSKDENVKYFNQHQVRMILGYTEKSYFNQFGLLKYAFGDQQKNEEIHFKVKVEIPLKVPPLSEALFKSINYIETRDESEREALMSAELEEREDIENLSPKKLSQVEQNEEEPEALNYINPKDLSYIEEKLREAEISMKNTLTTRQSELESKLEEMKGKPKK